ncbi:MAG TPA: MotA/TolQ/ExbB proton channel family protein [Chitinophagaceae bacterium]
MNWFLLQISNPATNTAVDSTNTTATNTAAQPSMNVMEMLASGGPLMIPLALLLVLAIFFFFERFIAIRKASRIEGNFMNIIRDHIFSGNLSAARSLAKNTDNPVARMIDKGLQRIGKPIDAIEKSMESVGKLEIYRMERNLSVLTLVYGIAPMFGFLGTIIGMLQLFYAINASGEFTPAAIAGGIYTKMITSASGLIIGLLAYVGYNFLSSQINKTVNRMEAASAEFMDILQEPTGGATQDTGYAQARPEPFRKGNY